ncbi:MAG TPA: hypothetical protein VNK91_13255 [Burkholderiaceae bacterium]|jgi:hypothetical protein|nr:hypothetical protein [Burkholderiaceae bacterium]
MPFVDCAAVAANCVTHDRALRATAARLWHGRIEPDAAVRAKAQATAARLAEAAPGRVESGGSFEDAATAAVLKRALPSEIAAALKPRFEWYGCRGAFFHNDAHFGDVLFGVWCLAGPARDLVFARLKQRIPVAFGDVVVFDPFEPHAVLARGAARYQRADYVGEPINVFLGFELVLDAAVRAAFGIGAPVADALEVSSRVPVHAETGALAPA